MLVVFLAHIGLPAHMGLLQAGNSYHGFVRSDFKLGNLNATLVSPTVPAKGRPWIWRTEFFDHRPSVDLALLKQGFHLAYLNLQNGYGSPEALYHYDSFYGKMVAAHNLNPKVVLEGFSRGGLSAYNWAISNADKVMAIYGDAPVCDFTSWPKRSPEAATDWLTLQQKYGFPNEPAALGYPFAPINRLASLAKAKVPIVHVVGTADVVVPVADNTDKLERNYRKLGGLIKVIRKVGVGHHPHSLDDPTPIVNFILEHQNRTAKAPLATINPTPNHESRYDGAGWNGRSWLDQHQDCIETSAKLQPKLVLLGDSITQSWASPGRKVHNGAGDAYQKYLTQFNTVAMGISGDRTQHVLWRLQNGALSRCSPQVIAILIGVNNLNSDSPEAIIAGVDAVILRVRSQRPAAQIVLQYLFPVGETPADPRRAKVKAINQGFEKLAKKHRILSLNLFSEFLLPDGRANPSRLASDNLHLAPGGYEIWGEKLSALIKRSLTNRKGVSTSNDRKGFTHFLDFP